MKLPELLKQAVEQEKWELVCAAYTAITGKPLSPPKPKPKEIDFSEFEIPDSLLNINLDVEEEHDTIVLPTKEQVILLTGETQEEAIVLPPKKDEEDHPSPKTTPSGESSYIAQARSEDSLYEGSQDGQTAAKKKPMKIEQRRLNQFKDTLQEDAHLLKANNQNMQKLYQNATHPRNIRDGEKAVDTGAAVQVQCSICETKERVSAALAHGYSSDPDNNTYKCNACCTSRGRRRVKREQFA